MTHPQRNSVPPHAWVRLTPAVHVMHRSGGVASVVDNGDGTYTLEQGVEWTVREQEQ